VSQKLGQEVVKHRAVVVMMHFDLAVLIRLVPLNGKALPAAVQNTAANINEDQYGIFVLYFLLQCLVKVNLFSESERFRHGQEVPELLVCLEGPRCCLGLRTMEGNQLDK
jgi:hypothetical protein